MLETVDTHELQPSPQTPSPVPPSPEPVDMLESGISFGILLICYPDERQEIFDLNRATVHIGRAPDNDVILNDDLIAEHHAQILCDNTGCQILDLGSHIGSQILERNHPEQKSTTGLRLPPKMPHPLLKGTTVLMGEILLIYYPTTDDIPKPPKPKDERLLRAIYMLTFALLFVAILGSTTVWVRSRWFSSTSLARSAEPTPRPPDKTPLPPPTVAPTVINKIYVVDTTFELNLHIREAPGLDKRILGKVPYGTVVQVLSEPIREGPYHWVRVDAPNLSGWCIFDGLRPHQP